MTLFTRGTNARVPATRSNLIPVILAGGMLFLLAFQGVRPVTLSISLSMSQVNCALNMGFSSGFPTALGWAASVPLPVPPLPVPLLGVPLRPPPPPRSGHLGNVVAGSLHPLIGMLRNTDLDWLIDQSFGVDDM